MTILKIAELAVDLGGRSVLRDVDLEVAAGELVGLLGPNGAGKTTLLRSVLGLVRPRAGRIDLSSADHGPATSGVGYVPQRHEFAWDHPTSVEGAVLTGRIGRLGLWRRARTADWAAVADALELVGLTDLRRRPVGELSGGQRQRVLVARALAVEPSLLLLDEPFTGLDAPSQELLSELFGRLVGTGRSVLMTTHDLVAAVDSCHRLVLLNRTVIAQGRPDELHDAEVWVSTFGVRPGSPLLRLVGAS